LLEPTFFAEGWKGFDKKDHSLDALFSTARFLGRRIIFTNLVCAARFVGVTAWV
jgi:hypothetical protein